MAEKKVSRGFRYHPEDLDRIRRLLRNRETTTDFIEMALSHEFEIREGKARLQYMTTLNA